jgi:hypothetical protein
MESMAIEGLTLYFDAEEREAAEVIAHACAKSVPLIHEYWGLNTPEDLRVYVMTSWLPMIFHSAPWTWRILLAVTLPLWFFQARRLWRLAGGWEQPFGRRRTVGIKPPWLLAQANRSIGAAIFVPELDLQKKVQHATCHELSHAFMTHLKLPAWLKEGLAMVTVDRYAGTPTVREETLETLERSSPQASTDAGRRLQARDIEALVYQCVRGYWITRYLDETQPAVLRDLLSHRQSHSVLEGRLASALGLDHDRFWHQIDPVVVAHFSHGGE